MIYSDDAVTKLRAIVAVLDGEMVQATPTPAIKAAWSELIGTLALGPDPETRECSACHRVGMRTASRCGHCWAALEPLAAVGG